MYCITANIFKIIICVGFVLNIQGIVSIIIYISKKMFVCFIFTSEPNSYTELKLLTTSLIWNLLCFKITANTP